MRWLAIIACMLSGPAWGTTNYVSTTGSAAWADCETPATPCSIATAQTSGGTGDIIILMDGTYTTGINTANNGTAGAGVITWQAQNNRMAILNGLASSSSDKVVLVDNAYHVFDGLVINVQTGPGAANTYGLFVSGATYTEFKNGEIRFTGDEATMGVGNIAYCAQIRSITVFTGNYVHNCTYGLSIFSSSASFIPVVEDNEFENMIVGDYEDSDCIAVSGAASYNWAGLIIKNITCEGWRDDAFDFSNQDGVIVQDSEMWDPIPDANGNSSCVKLGYEGANSNIARRLYCHGLNVDGQRNYGVIMVGASDSHAYSNIFVGGYTGADIAQRNATGGANNTLTNNSFLDFSQYGVQIYTGAASTVLVNNIFDGATADILVASGLTATGTNNRRVNGVVTETGTYNQTGDTDGAVSLVGSTGRAAYKPVTGSDLFGGGAYSSAVKYDNGNRRLLLPYPVGAWGRGSGDAAAARTARQ